MRNDKAPFLRGLRDDIIRQETIEMGRGPIMPSESLSTVLNGRTISLATLGSLPTMKMAVENARFDLMTLVTDLLHELKNPETYRAEDKGKILVKTTGVMPEQSFNQPLPFLKPETLPQQQNGPMSFSQYMQDNTNNRAA